MMAPNSANTSPMPGSNSPKFCGQSPSGPSTSTSTNLSSSSIVARKRTSVEDEPSAVSILTGSEKLPRMAEPDWSDSEETVVLTPGLPGNALPSDNHRDPLPDQVNPDQNSSENPQQQQQIEQYRERIAQLERENLEIRADRDSLLRDITFGRSENAIAREQLQTDLLEVLESELGCVICNDVYMEPVVVECGHIFCHHCISSWLNQPNGRNCPTCRVVVTKPLRIKGLEGYIGRLYTLFPPQVQQERDQVLVERQVENETREEDRIRRAAELTAQAERELERMIQVVQRLDGRTREVSERLLIPGVLPSGTITLAEALARSRRREGMGSGSLSGSLALASGPSIAQTYRQLHQGRHTPPRQTDPLNLHQSPHLHRQLEVGLRQSHQAVGQQIGQAVGQQVGQQVGPSVVQQIAQAVGQVVGQQVSQLAGQSSSQIGQQSGQLPGQSSSQLGQQGSQLAGQSSSQLGQQGSQLAGQSSGQAVQQSSQSSGQQSSQPAHQSSQPTGSLQNFLRVPPQYSLNSNARPPLNVATNSASRNVPRPLIVPNNNYIAPTASQLNQQRQIQIQEHQLQQHIRLGLAVARDHNVPVHIEFYGQGLLACRCPRSNPTTGPQACRCNRSPHHQHAPSMQTNQRANQQVANQQQFFQLLVGRRPTTTSQVQQQQQNPTPGQIQQQVSTPPARPAGSFDEVPAQQQAIPVAPTPSRPAESSRHEARELWPEQIRIRSGMMEEALNLITAGPSNPPQAIPTISNNNNPPGQQQQQPSSNNDNNNDDHNYWHYW